MQLATSKTFASSNPKNTQEKFIRYCRSSNFPAIAKLISHSLKVNSQADNLKIFGYIPNIFREVIINKSIDDINIQDIFIDEPVVYKIYFPDQKNILGINYIYFFCYFKPQATGLNVYFQSADKRDINLSQQKYELKQETINFEGVISSFEEEELSFISISDPGHFIPGLVSGFFSGSHNLNLAEFISQILTVFSRLIKIKMQDMLLVGSSAGTMGALLTSTYLKNKTNVMITNSQVTTFQYSTLVQTLFNSQDQEYLLSKYGNQLSCYKRFSQAIDAIPNLYILANVNDSLYKNNYRLYQYYQKRFVRRSKEHQSVFDSYFGIAGHGRPRKSPYKLKLKMAREILTMTSN